MVLCLEARVIGNLKVLRVLPCVHRLKQLCFQQMKCLSERDVRHSSHLYIFDYVTVFM